LRWVLDLQHESPSRQNAPKPLEQMALDDVDINARKNARRLRIDDGLWIVYELRALFDRRGPSLVFESEPLVRRVRIFPADWRDLSDTALALLMEQV